jgi:hypothetical protein
LPQSIKGRACGNREDAEEDWQVIAVCNANFHGDVLWSVPAARELSRRAGEKAHFYLSLRGAATQDLLRAQSFVHDVFVRTDFSSDDIVPEKPYSAVYQLHMRGSSAQDMTLLDHFCHVAGLPRQGHWFELPDAAPLQPLPKKFVVLAAKKGDGSEWMRAINDIFRDFVKLANFPIVEVGCSNMALAADLGTQDRCCQGFLEMARIIARCKVFVGTISAPLVLADAWPDVHRIALHDGEKWNLNNVTKSGMNHYLCYPSAQQLVELVRSKL